jgi:hypothetical protein
VVAGDEDELTASRIYGNEGLGVVGMKDQQVRSKL